MTESFTSGCLQVGLAARRRPVDLRVESGTYLDIHHHRHHGVDTGDGRAWSCGERPWTTGCAPWTGRRTVRAAPGPGGGALRRAARRRSFGLPVGSIRPPSDPRVTGRVSTWNPPCPRVSARRPRSWPARAVPAAARATPARLVCVSGYGRPKVRPQCPCPARRSQHVQDAPHAPQSSVQRARVDAPGQEMHMNRSPVARAPPAPTPRLAVSRRRSAREPLRPRAASRR